MAINQGQACYAKRIYRTLALIAQVMLSLLVIICLSASLISILRHDRIVPRWDRTRDPNISNIVVRFQNRNEDIEVPSSTNGVVLVESEAEDLSIEVDRRGWLSISNIQLSESDLFKIVEARTKKYPYQRVFLWKDMRSRAEQRNPIIALATSISPDSTYFVVKEGHDYTGINHNKGIDPYSR